MLHCGHHGRACDGRGARFECFFILSFRENMMAHQGSALDHTLLNHAGPTDLDVAMFHRDAGPGKTKF